MGILSFILGAVLGFMTAMIMTWKRFTNISSLLTDKIFINDLLKQQIKDLQAKKSKKYYRRKSYNKSASKASKQ